MHEFSLIENIIDTVNEIIEQNNLTSVSVIHLKIGRLRQVVEQTMHFAFEASTKDTLLENTELKITFVPILIQCNNCQHQATIDENLYFCPKCENRDVRVIEGDELLIERIEGEQ